MSFTTSPITVFLFVCFLSPSFCCPCASLIFLAMWGAVLVPSHGHSRRAWSVPCTSPTPGHSSAQGLLVRAAALWHWKVHGPWRPACDLPGQATPALPCLWCPPSPAKPASSQGAEPFVRLPQRPCLQLTGTCSPSSTRLFIFELSVPCYAVMYFSLARVVCLVFFCVCVSLLLS